LTRSRFAWQEGYGAFSYSKSQLPALIQYIDNQEQHHQTRTFLDEYRRFLDVFGIDYEEHYLFQPPD
jgi:putative transposase